MVALRTMRNSDGCKATTTTNTTMIAAIAMRNFLSMGLSPADPRQLQRLIKVSTPQSFDVNFVHLKHCLHDSF